MFQLNVTGMLENNPLVFYIENPVLKIREIDYHVYLIEYSLMLVDFRMKLIEVYKPNNKFVRLKFRFSSIGYPMSPTYLIKYTIFE